MAQSLRLCQAVVSPSTASQAVVPLVWAVVPPAQCQCQTDTGGGTARTQETRDEMFLGSKFEST